MKWDTGRIDGHSLHGLPDCLKPVNSVRSSLEGFPDSAPVSHLSVKQLGLKSNTVYFDSHKTLKGEGVGEMILHIIM